MKFSQKLLMKFLQFMRGRYARVDRLGKATLIAGLACSFLSVFLRSYLLTLLGYALYGISIYRLLSKNIQARLSEERRYVTTLEGIKTKFRQFVTRQKNRKQYKYFRCPGCKTLMRLTRGGGVKTVNCPKCARRFEKKS